MGTTPEQEGKLDTKQILAQMNLASVNSGLGIDPKKAKEWWVPVMVKTARVLIEQDKSDPSLPTGRLYELPYLRTLTAECLEEIGQKRADSVGSDLSEGAIEAINKFYGP